MPQRAHQFFISLSLAIDPNATEECCVKNTYVTSKTLPKPKQNKTERLSEPSPPVAVLRTMGILLVYHEFYVRVLSLTILVCCCQGAFWETTDDVYARK